MLSIIVPVLNERESLPQLLAEISRTGEQQQLELEVIFVDDGSRDGSWDVIRELAAKNSRVSGIRFRRNFGKAAALTAGMRAARGDLLMMMDADLQDDPAEIPNFLAKLNAGCDVVNGWKERRLDPWHKVYPSRVFNGMIGWLTGLRLHDHNCGLKLFRAAVAREITLYGELPPTSDGFERTEEARLGAHSAGHDEKDRLFRRRPGAGGRYRFCAVARAKGP